MFGRATIRLGIGPHSSLLIFIELFLKFFTHSVLLLFLLSLISQIYSVTF